MLVLMHPVEVTVFMYCAHLPRTVSMASYLHGCKRHSRKTCTCLSTGDLSLRGTGMNAIVAPHPIWIALVQDTTLQFKILLD